MGPIFIGPWAALACPVEQHITDMTDSSRRVQSFRANVDTVLNSMATENTERIIQLAQSLLSRCIAAVGQEAVSLKQTTGADEAIGVPPERRASG